MQPVPPAPSPIVLGSCDATEEVVIFVDAAGRASSFLRHLIAPVSLSQPEHTSGNRSGAGQKPGERERSGERRSR